MAGEVTIYCLWMLGLLRSSNGTTIELKKAPFSIFTVELDGDNYFKTLRDKLFWGYDTRNRQ